jgi:thiol:disulfide interchange protein DsbA
MNKWIRVQLLALLALVMAAPLAWAQNDRFIEGVHYTRIPQPEGAAMGDTVLVEEAFSYLCSHCNTMEPYIQAWKTRLPEGVEFKRIPVEFGRAIWGLYARAYITSDVLGVVDEGHPAMMDMLWNQRRQLRSMEELAEFYSQFGVEKERFLATADSFAVDMRMKREQQLVQQYGIQGTPSMVVNGKYLVSAGGQISSFDMLLDVVDLLVARELADQSARQAALN